MKTSSDAARVGFEVTVDGTILIQGSVIFDTVGTLYAQMNRVEAAASTVRMDWSKVEMVDSSGIALCLNWIEQAQKENVKIVFVNVPEQMKRLIRINQVRDLFQLE